MRNSTLLKWAQNSANSKNQTSKNGEKIFFMISRVIQRLIAIKIDNFYL